MADKNPHTPDDSPQSSGDSTNPNKDKVTEVRYIPVEYLPHQMENEEGEIDLFELGKNIWDGRWTIAKITGVFVAIGLFIALFSPVEYESEAILIPEMQQQQDRTGQLLQRFGGAFGIGGGTMQTQVGTIPPMVYPRIVNSLSFQIDLIDQPVTFADYGVTTTISDFYENHYRFYPTEWIREYTIGLPRKMINVFRGSEQINVGQESNPESEFIHLSWNELELVRKIRSRISVNIDQETGLLTTRVSLHDAHASAEMNKNLIELMKQRVTDYRIEKAMQDLEFVEEQHAGAKDRFENAQFSLAEFRDRNVSIATERARTELERLQDEKDLAFNVYNSMSEQLERARLKVQEQTPVFSVLQSVNIPTERAKPDRRLIVLVSLLLGIVVGVIFYFGKYFLITN